MRHSTNEIYSVRYNNKRIFATLAFCNSNDICFSRREAKEKGKTLVALQAPNIEGDRIKIYDTDRVFFGYVGNVATWFDEEKERNEFKARARKEREEFLAWNKIKKEIIAKLDEKTTEELQQILISL